LFKGNGSDNSSKALEMTNYRPKEISRPRFKDMGLMALRFAQLVRVVLILAIVCCVFPRVVSAQQDSSTQRQRQVKDPDQPNMDGLVEVSFKIDETGRIQIVHINSTSTQLTEYVVKKLTKIKLDTESGSEGKVITYRFVFKKQA
jgi:hypothetical protein